MYNSRSYRRRKVSMNIGTPLTSCLAVNNTLILTDSLKLEYDIGYKVTIGIVDGMPELEFSNFSHL